MAYADQQMSGNRIVAIIIVALIHIALGYALITGLAYNAVQQVVERVTTIDIEEPPPPEEEPPPPPENVPDTPPPPVASPRGQAGWARRIQSNYPRRAEREGIEGNVGVTITVGTDGRVASCRVSASSGSSDLDAAACDGMTRYARYNPAQDVAGNPIQDTVSTTIVYQLN